MHLFYVHGFLSGPNAAKATALKQYVKEHNLESQFVVEGLDFPDTPKEAFDTLVKLLEDFKKAHPHEKFALVGSSMGGFMSTLLAQRFCCKTVLLNPCVHPQDYFDKLIGPQYNSATERHFELTPDMIPYLKSLDESTIVRPDLLKVYLGGKDEVLDYRKSFLLYNTCDITFVKEEDHAFTKNFKALIPQILEFVRE